MQKLLIATTNPGKFAEMRNFLSDLTLALVSLQDVHISTVPEETGKTFEENAVIKAKYYCLLSGLPAIADDAGAEIDYLNGQPGVNTKRWVFGDRDSTDEEIILFTLKKLDGVPVKQRGMQLRSVIALALPNGDVFTSEGKIRGVIALSAAKDRYKGFPFRSLMYLPQLANKFYNHTVLSESENLKYNHRLKALKKLKRIINSYLTNTLEKNKI